MKILRIISILLLLLSCVYLGYASWHIVTTTAPDFLVYYHAARDVARHISPYRDHTLYTVFTYPPLSILILLPFAFLPVRTALGVFTLISVMSLLIAPRLALAFFPREKRLPYGLVTALYIWSFPAKFTLGMGQINAIAYCLLLAGWLLYTKKKGLLAVLLISLACVAKPICAFTIIVWFIHRRWDLVGASLAVAITLSGIIYIMYPSLYSDYMTIIIPHLADMAGREVYYNQGFLGFISRFTSDFMIRRIGSYISFIGIVVIGVIGMRRASHTRQLAIALSAIPLIDPLSWQHHFILLLLPIICAFSIIPPTMRWLLSMAYILVSVNISSPELVPTGLQPLVLSHVFWGAVMIFALVCWSQRGNKALNMRE